MIKITRKVLRILSSRQKMIAVFMLFLMLVGGLMESLGVSLILPLIGAVVDSDWRNKWYASLLCDFFNINSQADYIIVLLIALSVVFIVKNAYLLFEYYFQYSFISKSRFLIQKRLMHEYIMKPYSFYLNSNSGEIIRVVLNDTNQAFQLLTYVISFYTEGIVAFILAITITIISPLIAFFLTVILLIELFFISLFIKPVMRKMGNLQRTEYALCNKWILQAIQGIKSIKVSHTEEFFENEFCKHSEAVVCVDGKNLTLNNVPRLIIESFTVSGILLVIMVLVFRGLDLAMIVPQLSAFVVAAVRLLPSINRISSSINILPFLEGGLDNTITVLDNKSSVHIPSRYVSPVDIEEASDIGKFCSIDLRNVSFCYPHSQEVILDNVNLKILKGQSIGIIGPSGAGKTTVVDIMLGLLPVSGGGVFVNDVEIDICSKTWLNKVSYIPQSVFLMDDSIKNNILFGQSMISEERVCDVLRDSQLLEFVEKLPDGMDTIIGEQGVRLSGGQKQRIGIARALYTNPEVIFFDEATSALDNDTEEAIMKSIESLRGHKTIIIIAHRLSTIKKCDAVYKVENKTIKRVYDL